MLGINYLLMQTSKQSNQEKGGNTALMHQSGVIKEAVPPLVTGSKGAIVGTQTYPTVEVCCFCI